MHIPGDDHLMRDHHFSAARRRTATSEIRAIYERLAPVYDQIRRRSIRFAGAEAEAALLADIGPFMRPGARVLDAGCGTGAISRQMLAICSRIELTMLDISPAMLARTTDLPCRRLEADVHQLPFADRGFDLLVSASVLETVSDPWHAVSELLRVLDIDGLLVYTFFSPPRNHGHAPWHECGRSHRQRFPGGPASEVALAKCCPVDPGALPRSAN